MVMMTVSDPWSASQAVCILFQQSAGLLLCIQHKISQLGCKADAAIHLPSKLQLTSFSFKNLNIGMNN